MLEIGCGVSNFSSEKLKHLNILFEDFEFYDNYDIIFINDDILTKQKIDLIYRKLENIIIII